MKFLSSNCFQLVLGFMLVFFFSSAVAFEVVLMCCEHSAMGLCTSTHQFSAEILLNVKFSKVLWHLKHQVETWADFPKMWKLQDCFWILYSVEKLSRNDKWPPITPEPYKSAEALVLTTGGTAASQKVKKKGRIFSIGSWSQDRWVTQVTLNRRNSFYLLRIKKENQPFHDCFTAPSQ